MVSHLVFNFNSHWCFFHVKLCFNSGICSCSRNSYFYGSSCEIAITSFYSSLVVLCSVSASTLSFEFSSIFHPYLHSSFVHVCSRFQQRSGKLNKKSDVYSFGMILLQLITGCPPIRGGREDMSFILDWIQPKIECGDIEAIVDPRLASEEFHVTSTWKAVEVAMSCGLPTPSQRPNISYILQELHACLALEMDQHARIIDNNIRPINYSRDYTGNSEPITILSAR